MPLREKLKDLKIYKINHSQFAMKKKEENSVTVKIFHQQFSTEMILLPGEHLEISEDIFGCHKWRGALGTQQVELD